MSASCIQITISNNEMQKKNCKFKLKIRVQGVAGGIEKPNIYRQNTFVYLTIKLAGLNNY